MFPPVSRCFGIPRGTIGQVWFFSCSIGPVWDLRYRPGKSHPVQCGSGLWYEVGLICPGLLRIRVWERVWSEPTVCLSPETDNGHGLRIGKGQGRRKLMTWDIYDIYDIYDGKVATQWVVKYFNQSVNELRKSSLEGSGIKPRLQLILPENTTLVQQW